MPADVEERADRMTHRDVSWTKDHVALLSGLNSFSKQGDKDVPTVTLQDKDPGLSMQW